MTTPHKKNSSELTKKEKNKCSRGGESDKKKWSELTKEEKSKCSRDDKLAFFDEAKSKLVKNIIRRDLHEKEERYGNPRPQKARTQCHNAISSARDELGDLAGRLKPAPDFNYSDDNACREEFRMADKNIHKHKIAKESTGSPANSPAVQFRQMNTYRQRARKKLVQRKTRVADRSAAKFSSSQTEDEDTQDSTKNSAIEISDDPGDSDYAEKHNNPTMRSGKNEMGTRVSTRSMSKKEFDRAQNNNRNPDAIDLGSMSENESEPESEYYYYLRPLPNSGIPSGYPRYDSGDVVIMLFPKNSRFQYQLHEESLRGKSSRLDAELNKCSQEACQELKNESTQAIKRLGLTFHLGEWFIGRTSFTMKLPKGDSPKPYGTKFSEPPFEILESFDNLFMIFYELPPDIDTDDTSIGFEQTGWLIELSRAYNCEALALKAIRQVWESLGNNLVRYILHDPPRWLRFGWIIQSTMIVREALIHVVAVYPDWKWPTDEDILTSEIRTLIENKADNLWANGAGVIISLIQISTELIDRDNNASRLVQFRHPEFYEMLVTAVWQDWFRQQYMQCNNENCGNLFRIIQNPDAYLSEADLRAKLGPFQDLNSGDLEVFASYLKILKGLAEEQVSGLTQNFSKIGIQNFKDFGIGWLTCTNVEEHELPWGH